MSDFLAVGALSGTQQYQALTGQQRQAVDAMVARAKGIGGDPSRLTTAEIAQEIARQEAAAAFLRKCICGDSAGTTPKPSNPVQPTVGGFNVTRPHAVTARRTTSEEKPNAPRETRTETRTEPQVETRTQTPAVPQRQRPDGAVHHLDDSNFDAFLKDNEAVLVDFYADWCGPCRALGPRVEAVARDRNAAVGKVNVDNARQVAKRYGVRSLPTVMMFVNGEPVQTVVGLQSESALRGIVRTHAD